MDDEDLIASLVGEMDLVGQYDDEPGPWDVGGDEVDELLALVQGGDLIGAQELIGARPSRQRKQQHATRRQLAALLQRARAERGMQASTGKPVVARPSEPTKGRVLLFGGEATQGAQAGQLLIPSTAQEMCRVDRLYISALTDQGAVISNAAFAVADIKVGTRSQLSAIGNVPGIMFQADANGQGFALSLDTVQPGTTFTVIIASAPALSRFTWGAYATALR